MTWVVVLMGLLLLLSVLAKVAEYKIDLENRKTATALTDLSNKIREWEEAKK